MTKIMKPSDIRKKLSEKEQRDKQLREEFERNTLEKHSKELNSTMLKGFVEEQLDIVEYNVGDKDEMNFLIEHLTKDGYKCSHKGSQSCTPANECWVICIKLPPVRSARRDEDVQYGV